MRAISDYIVTAVIIAAVGLVVFVAWSLCRATEADDFMEESDDEECK